MRSRILTSIFVFLLAVSPAFGQENGTDESIPGTEAPGIEMWSLPGVGAGPIYVNDLDGTVWTFFHQTHNIVKMDGSTGDVLLNIPLTISPTALAFSTCGTMVYLVGEPMEDQIIDVGIIQVISESDGSLMQEMEVEGACNAVYVSDGEIVWVASGMQYAYQGNILRLEWTQAGTPGEDPEADWQLAVTNRADCGKIPWAIAESDGKLYVTDLELQWTLQPDGTMGPPYGAWVWAYDADTLEVVGQEWVGINPNKLEDTNFGVIVGCSGSKQSEGAYAEPAVAVIGQTEDPRFIYIGTAGASDVAASPDGSWAVASLSDWGQPDWSSSIAIFQQQNPGAFPELRKWIYTGDLALMRMENGEISTERVPIVAGSFIRAVAVSSDGMNIYAIEGEPERLLVIPVEMIENSDGEPLLEEE
jgi:hypothetical protein